MVKVKKKPQKQRFIDKAKELGVDETGKAFEVSFKKIVKPKKASRPS